MCKCSEHTIGAIMCYCQEDLCNEGTCIDEYCHALASNTNMSTTPALVFNSTVSAIPGFSQDQSSMKSKPWLVVGVVLGVATLIAAITFGSCLWYYVFRKHAETSQTSQSCETLNIKSLTEKSESYVFQKRTITNQSCDTRDMKSLTETHVQITTLELGSVEFMSKIGNGRFSEVWKAILYSKTVAVKIYSEQDRKYWSTEVNAYSYPHMKHKNVCDFITGSHSNGPKPGWWIVLEYHECGSLQDYLKVHSLTKEELCKMADSVACGLAYLHSEMAFLDDIKPAMAHRDVKSMNVLVKEDLTCCICDLELSITFEPGKSLLDRQAQVGTLRYMAPEVLDGAVTFSRESYLKIDVYALGLVIWEMISRCTVRGVAEEYKQPYETEVGVRPTVRQMTDCVVTSRVRPKFPACWGKAEEECDPRTLQQHLDFLMETVTECWDHDPDARLTAQCVQERMSSLILAHKETTRTTTELVPASMNTNK